MASSSELSRNIGRIAAGGLIAASLFQVDCTPTVSAPVQSAAERGRSTPIASPAEIQPVKDLAKEELLRAVDTLPASPLQRAVSARLHRYYGEPQPDTISYGDVSFPIVSPTVIINRRLTRDKDGVDGNFNFRKNTPTTNVLSSIDNITLFIPIDDLLLEGEINQLPKQYHGPNNMLMFPFTFPAGGKFVEAIKPFIEVNVYESPRKFFSPKETQDLIRMTLIKEACSLALQDIFVSKVVNNMNAMNVPTRIDAYTSNGDRVKASPVADVMALLSNNKGRFTASLDLGGYLLMFKLIEGTAAEQALMKLNDYPEAISSARQFNVPSDLSQLFIESVLWINSNPAAQKLGHMGDFSLKP